MNTKMCSLKPLCSGMGEVVPARTSPTLLPPSPRTVLSLSCFKVLQCINCRDQHCKISPENKNLFPVDSPHNASQKEHTMLLCANIFPFLMNHNVLSKVEA